MVFLIIFIRTKLKDKRTNKRYLLPAGPYIPTHAVKAVIVLNNRGEAICGEIYMMEHKEYVAGTNISDFKTTLKKVNEIVNYPLDIMYKKYICSSSTLETAEHLHKQFKKILLKDKVKVK